MHVGRSRSRGCCGVPYSHTAVSRRVKGLCPFPPRLGLGGGSSAGSLHYHYGCGSVSGAFCWAVSCQQGAPVPSQSLHELVKVPCATLPHSNSFHLPCSLFFSTISPGQGQRGRTPQCFCCPSATHQLFPLHSAFTASASHAKPPKRLLTLASLLFSWFWHR